MKIIVIGAVAAGTSAAAKARRKDDHAQITIYEKDTFISYSGCGMPYFIGGEVESVDSLTPRTPSFFKKKYNIDVKIGHEVVAVDVHTKTVQVKKLETEELFEDRYDKLVFATGARAFVPPIVGRDKSHVFTLRNINDAMAIKNYIVSEQPKSVVIAGTGFIGLELLDNLKDMQVNIVEVADQITPTLDSDMAKYLQNKMQSKGVAIHTGVAIMAIQKEMVSLSNDVNLAADMVILSTGVRPNVELAKQAGITLGITGAIKVDPTMKTNIEDVYACGDCIETFALLTGKPTYRPLGSTANKTGRIAGDNLIDGVMTYKGNLGTGIFKVFDLTVAHTGLTEKEALELGYDVQVCHNIKPDKPEYMGGKEMLIKAIACKGSGRLLGAQIVGFAGVDKRIDVIATLVTYRANVEDLFDLDLAYAPPFSTTKDPIHYTGMILSNAIHTNRMMITTTQLKNFSGKIQIIDSRSALDFEKKGTVAGAINMPHASIRSTLDDLDKEVATVTFCNKGVTGNAAQNILISHGFKKVYNLSGGHRFYKESK